MLQHGTNRPHFESRLNNGSVHQISPTPPVEEINTLLSLSSAVGELNQKITVSDLVIDGHP